MIKNYLKIAFRNILRYKAFSFINIAGLAVGMASAILIFLWMYNQVTFDNFHEKKDRIYEVWNRSNTNGKINCWNVTPMPLGPALQKDCPEIEQVARINYPEKFLFSYGDKRLVFEGCVAEPSFLNIFSYPLIAGNMETALKDPFSLVISEKMAQTLFGKEDPMGKVIKLENAKDFTVTGVLKDLPTNTYFKFDYLVSWLFMKEMGYENQHWGNNCIATYALLKPNTTLASVETKVKDMRRVYEKDSDGGEMFLYPMSRWHLYSEFVNGKEEGGLISRVKIAGLLAFFILLIACINFMNLSTARSEKRAKEVGIRKVVGAQKGFLIGQFIGESILMAFIAGVIALVLVFLFLPSYSRVMELVMSVDFTNPLFWVAFLSFIVLTGLLAGLYPAFFLSSFKPVSVLKGTFKKVNALVTPRKALVVLQFTLGLLLSDNKLCTASIETLDTAKTI
jgi:putative ABC transport system permease protein